MLVQKYFLHEFLLDIVKYLICGLFLEEYI
jgi:hypothetical protein